MRLKRIGDRLITDHLADSSNYSPHSSYRGGKDEGERIYVHFERFGAGAENTSLFRVSLEWSDVEAIVRAFSDTGHPEAVRLERARKLAGAIEDVAKNSN